MNVRSWEKDRSRGSPNEIHSDAKTCLHHKPLFSVNESCKGKSASFFCRKIPPNYFRIHSHRVEYRNYLFYRYTWTTTKTKEDWQKWSPPMKIWNWITKVQSIPFDPCVSMANNLSMGFNLKSPAMYIPRRKVRQGCGVIDRYPAFFKQPSGFTAALYCTIFTRELSACKMTALSLSLSSCISLCPSFSSRFFTNRESTGIRHPFKTDYFTVNWWCWHRGCERFIKMQAYNFSLDGLSHGFFDHRVSAALRAIGIPRYPRSQWTSVWTGCVFWIARMLNCSCIFFGLRNIYRWAKRNFIFLASTIKEFVNLITIIK